jgi:hypothetical protein
MNDFIPYHVLLKSIELFDKCKCDRCQKEKKKREDMLLQFKSVKDEQKNK